MSELIYNNAIFSEVEDSYDSSDFITWADKFDDSFYNKNYSVDSLYDALFRFMKSEGIDEKYADYIVVESATFAQAEGEDTINEYREKLGLRPYDKLMNNSRRAIKSMHLQMKDGFGVSVSVYALYEFMQKFGLDRTEYGLTIDANDGYYDLRDEGGTIVCMDGETCEVRGGYYNTDHWVVLYNPESEKEFKLTREEFKVACFTGRDSNVNNSRKTPSGKRVIKNNYYGGNPQTVGWLIEELKNSGCENVTSLWYTEFSNISVKEESDFVVLVCTKSANRESTHKTNNLISMLEQFDPYEFVTMRLDFGGRHTTSNEIEVEVDGSFCWLIAK